MSLVEHEVTWAESRHFGRSGIVVYQLELSVDLIAIVAAMLICLHPSVHWWAPLPHALAQPWNNPAEYIHVIV